MKVSEEQINELREKLRLRYASKRKSSRKSLAGKRFGRLEAIEEVASKHATDIYWVCKCDCGNKTLADSSNLTMGKIKSCGCLRTQNWFSEPEDFIYNKYKGFAKQRQIEFSLSKEFFLSLINKNCSYCGCPPSQKLKRGNGKRWKTMVYTGIDRVDSNVSYVPENVVPCCEFCNRAKLNLDLREFCWWLDQFEINILKKHGILK